MKIATTKTTVRALLALLENASHDEEVSFTRATKREPVPCWCGCGGTTKSKFVPGHDSKFHGQAKRVARGEATLQPNLDRLPHDEARGEFERHVTKESPLFAAREEEKAEKRATREEEKAEKKAAKAALDNATSEDEATSEFYSEVEDEVLATA